MLFRNGIQLNKPLNFWKPLRGNKQSKEHPLTHSFTWARVSSISMSNCLPGNWRKQSLLYTDLCTLLFTFSSLWCCWGAHWFLLNCLCTVCAYICSYLHTYMWMHSSWTVFAFLNAESFPLACASVHCMGQASYYTQQHCMRLRDYWKLVAYINHFICIHKSEVGRQINWNFIKHLFCLIKNYLKLSSFFLSVT